MDKLERIRAALAKHANLARRNIKYNGDPRFLELHAKEGHYRGSIYDTRPYDWRGNLTSFEGMIGGSNTGLTLNDLNLKPVEKRRPTAPYYLGRIVTNRFVALLCGERRFPRIRIPKSVKTEAFVNELARTIQLKAKTTEAATLGGAVGSVIMAFNVVEGRFRIESFNTKWCNIEWDDFHNAEMSAFCIVYPQLKQEYNEEKKVWETKAYLYRRIITTEVDVTYELQAAKISTDGMGLDIKPLDPNSQLVIDKEKSFYHGLGFVPAQFVQNLPRYDQVDGDTNCETAYDLFDRISENLSAIHSAQQGNLDPTLVLKITPEDYKKLEKMGGVVQTGANGAALVVGDKGDAKYIEIVCEGIKVAMEIVDKLRTYALELCDCVIADPHRITGAAQSAAAIAKLYAPMLSKADILRSQYGDNGIKKLLGKMLQAYFKLQTPEFNEEAGGMMKGQFKPLWRINPETKKPERVEPEKDVEAEDMVLQWGDYFELTAADIFQAVEAASMAVGGGSVATTEVATKFIAPYLGDSDPDTSIAEIKKEQEADRQHELALGTAKGKAKPTYQRPTPNDGDT